MVRIKWVEPAPEESAYTVIVEAGFVDSLTDRGMGDVLEIISETFLDSVLDLAFLKIDRHSLHVQFHCAALHMVKHKLNQVVAALLERINRVQQLRDYLAIPA